MGKCLLTNTSCIKTFVIFRELDQDLLHAPHLEDKPKKKTRNSWTTSVFSPWSCYLHELSRGRDLLLIQCLSPSLPPQKCSRDEGRSGRRNHKNCSWFARPLETLLRGSPCGGGWGGIEPNATWCIPFPWYLLWPHNSKLRVKIRGEQTGNP